jgi:hypothetical protein
MIFLYLLNINFTQALGPTKKAVSNISNSTNATITASYPADLFSKEHIKYGAFLLYLIGTHLKE